MIPAPLLHFSREEFAERRARALNLAARRGMDGLLLFRQESMHYLTGYDTFGHAFFQCMRLNACGYSLGAVFGPSWMDWPMLYHGNPAPARENMVIFVHIILMDSDTQTAMTLGQTYLIGENGAESLSRAGLELVVK